MAFFLMRVCMHAAVLKTKLGPARPVPLRDEGAGRIVEAFPCSPTGRPLTHEEAAGGAAAFRAVLLATDGRYPGRVPFRAVFGLVAGRGRLVLYDRFGMAARYEGAKPLHRRRGIKFEADRETLLALAERFPLSLLGFTGAYLCPACGADRVLAPPPSPHLVPPLCARCASRGPGPRDWVGTWTCPTCGDRVKEEALTCPFCEGIEREGGQAMGFS